MNQNTKAYLIGAAIGSSIVIIKTARETRRHRELRRQIAASTEAEIRRIQIARDIVCNRISLGQYGNRLSMALIMNDFEFERIIQDQDM